MNNYPRFAVTGALRYYVRRAVCAVMQCVFFASMTANSFAQPALTSAIPMFKDLPGSWKVVRESHVTGAPLQNIANKLQVPLSSLYNTVFEYERKQVQINVLETRGINEARKLTAILQKTKSNPRWVVQNKTSVVEFVVRDPQQAYLANQARYDLSIFPQVAHYKVRFDAIPIKHELGNGGPDGRNRLYNRLLQLVDDPTGQASVVQELRHQFEIGHDLVLVSDLQKSIRADWQFRPAAERTVAKQSGEVHAIFQAVPETNGLPMIAISGSLTIDSRMPRPVELGFNEGPLLQATPAWPVDANEIQVACSSIVSPSDSGQEKLRKLQAWFLDPKNIRYDGLMGSRYGVLQAFEQKFGRCWDYSDLFVTMARCMGLPCRQVYGWLYQGEGHVWCDVLVDGKWQMIDPTSGTICGSDYLPFCLSDAGEFSLLYAGPVKMEWEDSGRQN